MEEREDGLTRRQDLTERHSSLGLPLLNMNRKRREQHAEERSRGENQLHGIYTVPENTAAPARMNNSSTVKEPPLVEPIWKKLPYRIQNVYTDTSTEEEEAPAPIKPHPNGYYVTTLAGNPLMNGGYRDGKGANAHFDTPGGSVGVDKHDGVVYLADSYNQRIRKIRPNGETTTIAGTFYRGAHDGMGTEAAFNYPYSVAVSPDRSIYVSDFGNSAIRRITPNRNVTTVYSEEIARSLEPNDPPDQWLSRAFPIIRHQGGITIDAYGRIYVANSMEDNILRIDDRQFQVDVIGGYGTLTEVLTINTDVKEDLKDGYACESRMARPQGIDVDDDGNVYVADTWNERIRKISRPPPGFLGMSKVSTLAGYGEIDKARDGLALLSTFAGVFDCAYCKQTGKIYIADKWNNRIRCLMPNGKVATVCGTEKGLGDGMGLYSKFNLPSGVTAMNGTIYVTDAVNHCVRKINFVGNE